MNSVQYFSLLTVTLFFFTALAADEVLDESFIAQELQRTQSAPDSVATVSIAAPVDFVFEFLTRRPNEYTADAVGVAFDHSESASADALGRGSIRTIALENGGILFQRFLMLDRPDTYAYLTDMENSTASLPLKYSIARYELTEVTDGTTELRVALVYQPSSRLLAFFVRRAFRSALQSDFERAAELIQAAWNDNL